MISLLILFLYKSSEQKNHKPTESVYIRVNSIYTQYKPYNVIFTQPKVKMSYIHNLNIILSYIPISLFKSFENGLHQ